MKHTSVGGAFLLRIETGEEILPSVLEFARAHSIEAGVLSGLGAAYGVVLGYFDRRARDYVRMKVEEEVEIVSMQGNLALKEGQPYAHVHVTVSGRDFRALAGHLFEGRAGATCEVLVTPFPGTVRRIKDDRTGLFLLDL
jgi:predicted DNA-binding protein with PD1-like motif